MFCHKGFIPFSALFNKACWTHYNEVYDYYLGWIDSEWQFLNTRSDQLFKHWLLRLFESDLYLSDGKSSLVRVDRELVSDFVIDLAADSPENLEKANIPENLQEKYGFAASIDPAEVNKIAKLIKIGEAERKIQGSETEYESLIYRHVLRSGSIRPHLFLSGYSCIVDLDLFRHLYETSEEYKQLLIDLEIIEPSYLVDDFAKILSDFEGLALCVPEDVVEAKWDNFWRDRGALELSSWNTRLDDDFRQNPSRRKGRPKLSLAHEAFSKMNFQKGELSWEALARKIQTQSGEKPSARTLRTWTDQNKNRIVP